MPTDTSQPNWVCDICRTSFGTDLARAQLCESAGPPVYLPDGALVLHHSARGQQPYGYRLVALTRAAVIGTTARHGTGHGHVANYEMPGVIYDGRPQRCTASALWPHRPGCQFVNVHVPSRASGLGNLSASIGVRHRVEAWPLELTGLAGDHPAAREVRLQDVARGLGDPVRVAPLTGPVRAVLDMLGAVLEEPSWYAHYGNRDSRAVIAAEATSDRDGLPAGTYNPARLAWWLGQADPAALGEEAAARQQAWMRGEPGTAPLPRLRSRRLVRGYRISKSKLTKPQRELVAAAGLEWPDRASADHYLNLLVETTLGIPMTSTADDRQSVLFSTIPVRIGVSSSKGGVGKTTVAASLGAALAAAGRHVLLVDLNLPNPGQHVIWHLGPAEADHAARLIRGTKVDTGRGGGELRVFSHGQMAPEGHLADALIPVQRAGEWLTFLAGALDIRGVDTLLFDMPPGWDAVHEAVFDQYQVGLTASVHVTTGHPLALQTETFPPGQPRPRDDPRTRVLVENLSRASGPLTTDPAKTAEIRLHDTTAQAVRALADRQGLRYAGSLPWQPDPLELARSSEITALAAALVASSTAPGGAS